MTGIIGCKWNKLIQLVVRVHSNCLYDFNCFQKMNVNVARLGFACLGFECCMFMLHVKRKCCMFRFFWGSCCLTSKITSGKNNFGILVRRNLSEFWLQL